MRKRNTDKLVRAKARPDPAQWGEDEVMTLVEAAAVFFPQGPLTLSSLRRAAAAGTLEIAKVATHLPTEVNASVHAATYRAC